MSNQHTNYARLAGALSVHLASALAVLKYQGETSSWAKEEAESIENLLKEIDEGKYVEECVDSKGCSF